MYVRNGLSGLGVAQAGIAKKATDLFTPADIAFLEKVWPTVRVAARWTDPRWDLIGFPSGPAVTPRTFQIMNFVWPTVRVAAKFDDINWAVTPIPSELLPAVAQAVPEVSVTPAPTMTVSQSAPPPAVPVVGENVAPVVPTVVSAPAPVAQPVPEAVQPYAPFPAPYIPAPLPLVNIPATAAPVQAGMFGGNTLLLAGLATAAALIFAVRSKRPRARGRRR